MHVVALLSCAVALAPQMQPPAAPARSKRTYINFTGFPFPLGPFLTRRTVRETIVPGRAWSFEQEQSLIGIAANTRMVVIKLRSGALWCYNPVAPTDELLDLLSDLGEDGAGPEVAHIVLGTTQYEHKIFVGPFSRKFPRAAVHCVPDQWSFPIDLPPVLFGFKPEKASSKAGPGLLKDGAAYAWGDELQLRVLRPQKRLGFGYAAVEAAFVHADTKLLVVTDALVRVPRDAPKVLQTPSLAALGRADAWVVRGAALVDWRGQGAALDAAAAAAADGDEARRGWRRNALLALYFGPSPESIMDPRKSFEALAERWAVAPVCASLIYASKDVRPALRDWVEAVASLDFELAAPSHFSFAKCTPKDFRRAFAAVLGDAPAEAAPWDKLRAALGLSGEPERREDYDAGDVRLLSDISKLLLKLGVI
ncbi:hypothetical protein M885DRAFT_486172 [Pelagophyceae sp. CCMP2097]|nr:hypothetical protein M885DRAFT_486172 [Pelagophyceae sp. CCMP2097]